MIQKVTESSSRFRIFIKPRSHIASAIPARLTWLQRCLAVVHQKCMTFPRPIWRRRKEIVRSFRCFSPGYAFLPTTPWQGPNEIRDKARTHTTRPFGIRNFAVETRTCSAFAYTRCPGRGLFFLDFLQPWFRENIFRVVTCRALKQGVEGGYAN